MAAVYLTAPLPRKAQPSHDVGSAVGLPSAEALCYRFRCSLVVEEKAVSSYPQV